MTFGVNTSPFAGREGKVGLGTSRRLRERLFNEVRQNVALRVEDGDQPDRFVVSGRGELHLGILIETMRREGYEFEVSKPEVIFKPDEETGDILEPVEDVHIEVADDMTGVVFELMGARRGEMLDMYSENGTTFIIYRAPTRFLLGLQSQFIRSTSGMGQLHTLFYGYQPITQALPPQREFGSLVADSLGVTTPYALVGLQQRGTFFIDAQVDVYEGMVVGEHIRPEDLSINVVRAKHLTNFRAKPSETSAGLIPPRRMSLDDWIEFMDEDELLEVTPLNLRLRKRILNSELRQKTEKAKRKLVEA
jgi:GTP-binding protein